MRRTVKKQYWLTPDEDAELKRKARMTCLSEAALTRFLINGFVPKQKPDEKVAEFLRQLILLGNNLDRLLTKAYSLGYIDTPLLQNEIQKWNQFQLAVEKEFLCPEKSDPFGNK